MGSATLLRVTEQTGQRGEVETGTSSADDSRAATSQDEADEMAGPNEQSGDEGDAGSSTVASGSSADSADSSDASDSASSESTAGSGEGASSQDAGTSGSSSDSGSSGSGSGSSTATAQQQDQQQDQQQAQQPDQQAQEPQGEDAAPQGRRSRAPLNVGELLWKVAGVLATVVRIVGYVLAAVLVAFLVLTFVGVNTANGVAQLIGRVADVAVLSFRDLFLIADPAFATVVNFGLAAIFWVLVAEFGARLVRWLGARLS